MNQTSLVRQWYYAAIVAGCVAIGQAVTPLSFYSVFVAIVAIIIATAVFREAREFGNAEVFTAIFFIVGCMAMVGVWAPPVGITVFCAFLIYFLYTLYLS